MVNYFIWLISLPVSGGFKKEGISSSYILPQTICNGFDRSLANANIWIILRERRDVIYGLIRCKRVEIFVDGLNKGDYLLTVDLTNSFKITNAIASQSNFQYTTVSNLKIGINEISIALNYQLCQFIISRIPIKLQDPSKLLMHVEVTKNVFHEPTLAKSAYNAIIQSFALDEIWASQGRNVLPPFAHFAFVLIKNSYGLAVADRCKPYLLKYDPLFELTNTTSDVSNIINDEKVRVVDVDFVEIDIQNIYARKFISSDSTNLDLQGALSKTENSEKLHQDMLRDICQYLKNLGIVVYESDSVDMMFEYNGRTSILEIKSIGNENLIAQYSKGCFQVAYYLEAMKENYAKIYPALVANKSLRLDQQVVCMKVAARLNIRCLTYDPDKDWPDRVPDLLNFNEV